MSEKLQPREHPVARKLYEIIFESDTLGGKTFDLALLVAIVVSVVAVSLETVEAYEQTYAYELQFVEWTFTILFTLEYVVRIACVKRPSAYVFSFFGLVDLLSFLPTYVAFAMGGGTRSFAVIRALRLLRVFRILELSWVESEANSLRKAVWDARAKVVVFFVTVLIIVTIAGAAMYEIERVPTSGDAVAAAADSDEPAESTSQFESIPQSIYWAIITMTTVGYGDVVPQTTAGKFVAALLVLLGYSLIIVPTGFVSAELSDVRRRTASIVCPNCSRATSEPDAAYCAGCGGPLG